MTKKEKESKEFMDSLTAISEQKGISAEVVLEALETALATACKKNTGSNGNVDVEIDRETGEIHVYSNREVKEVPDPEMNDLSFDEAREMGLDDPQEGDVIRIEVTPKDFGRVAAQTAKQVVMQKIREAEREIIFEDFTAKIGETVTGTVQKITKNVVIINIEKGTNLIEVIMPKAEQSQLEHYEMNQQLKVVIKEVNQTTKGPQIIVSRNSIDLIKRLFENEIPEVYDGIVEIKNIIREAGSKTKVAVYSHDVDVEPLGTCVGKGGSRINNIMKDLGDEKIDIVVWSDDIKEYITNALSPATVLDIDYNEEEKAARVIVPTGELSLAIGKKGQNARMAARLVGCKIDIKGDEPVSEEASDEE